MAPLNDDADDLETSLLRALHSRSTYLKSKVDDLTLPSVRRLLEEDLGFEPHRLDAHKALIKRLVDQILNDTEKPEAGTEKPARRRKKSSRVVEDLQDGDLDTSRSDRGSGVRAAEDTGGDGEKSSEMTAEKSKKEANSSEKVGKKKQANSFEKLGNGDGAEVENESNPSESIEMKDVEKLDGRNDSLDVPAADTKVHGMEEDDEDRLDNGEEEIALTEGDIKEPLEKKAEVPVEESTVTELVQDRQERVVAEDVSEDAVKSALMKRAAELKLEVESLTLTSVRHLLAKDLGLQPDGLRMHKPLIRRLVDELLGSAEEEPSMKTKQDRVRSAGEEGPAVKVEGKLAARKRKQHVEEDSEGDEKRHGNGAVRKSEAGEERQRKQLQKQIPVSKKKIAEAKDITDVKRPFSAKVERLREIMKAAGITISPIIYRKAKQVPESERDETLVNELENRLKQEGLSSNPSEKEIRKVKARLEKKRDLDGIESTNIVTESRRTRGAPNSWFTPRQSNHSRVKNIVDTATVSDDSDDEVKPQITGAMDDMED